MFSCSAQSKLSKYRRFKIIAGILEVVGYLILAFAFVGLLIVVRYNGGQPGVLCVIAFGVRGLLLIFVVGIAPVLVDIAENTRPKPPRIHPPLSVWKRL